MKPFLLVCLGGACGSGARYLLAAWVDRAGAYPWGTLLVNVLGCFAIEVVLAGAAAAGLSAVAVTGLTTGVLGGFTTYSAFNHQVLALGRGGSWSLAVGYAAATVAGCLAAGLAGIAIGRALWAR